MSGPARDDAEAAAAAAAAREAAARKRRLDEIFGDVVPDTTRDERDPDTGGSPEGESASDAWLRRQVPPHHGS